jgi:PAS domain S-box-containing protein
MYQMMPARSDFRMPLSLLLRPVVAVPLGAFLLLAAVLAVTLVVLKRRRDRELRASEALMREILDAAPDAMVGVDAAGRIVLTNAAATRLFGFSRAELIGAPVDTLMPRVPAERHVAHRAGFFANPKARPMGLDLDLVAVRKDGTLFPVDISLNHLRTGDEGIAFAAIRDVTQRKRDEDAGRQSEARLRALADATFAVMWRTDARDRRIGDNATWSAFTGQSEEEIRDGRWIEAVHPDDHARLGAVVSRAMAEGSPYRVESRLRRFDGEWRDVVARAAPIRDSAGAVREWIGAAVDVTERKRGEEAERKGALRLHTVLNNAPITLFALDEQGTFTLSEGKGLEKIGLKPGDNVGVSAIELYGTLAFLQPDGSTVNGLDAVRRVMAGETVTGVSRLNGEYFDNRMVPECDAEGRVIGMIGVATIVTERKLADDAVRANEERLRVALSGLNVAVFHQDLALRYTWMFQPQLGYAVEDVVGHTDAELLPPEAARRITVIKRRVLETGERAHGEVSIAVEGATLVFDLVAEPLRDAGGALIGLTGATLDITERRQAQMVLEESQREIRDLAAHLDAIREEERAALARNLHDDLGQTLTVLKMDLRTLRRQVAKGGTVSSATLDALDELLDGVIATGRQVASELRAPVLEGLGLRDSVESQAAEFFRRTGIHCDVTCALGDVLVDDRTSLLLCRITQESLTNVTRHAAATAVAIAIHTAGDDLVLRVEDNGRGIAAERPPGGRFGIIGMRERTLAVGGRFEVRGGVRGGTVVEVVVPLGGREAMKGRA